MIITKDLSNLIIKIIYFIRCQRLVKYTWKVETLFKPYIPNKTTKWFMEVRIFSQ